MKSVNSPRPRRVASPKRRVASPKRRVASPKRRVASPKRRVASPKRQNIKNNKILIKSSPKIKSIMKTKPTTSPKTIFHRPLSSSSSLSSSPLSRRLKAYSSRVIIFGRAGCGWCQKAKEMFEGMRVPYTFVDILDPATNFSREDMVELNEITAPVDTVPRIFVDGKFVGGFSDTSEKIKNGFLKF